MRRAIDIVGSKHQLAMRLGVHAYLIDEWLYLASDAPDAMVNEAVGLIFPPKAGEALNTWSMFRCVGWAALRGAGPVHGNARAACLVVVGPLSTVAIRTTTLPSVRGPIWAVERCMRFGRRQVKAVSI
jgi:hypothetical protein